MYVFKGSTRQGGGIRHYRYALHLEQSLVELFKLYEEAGGPAPVVEPMIEERINAALGEVRGSRELLQAHLHTLLRARDIHRFVTGEPELVGLKQRLIEHVLFHRRLEPRWAAIRALLLEHIDTVCGAPLPGAGCHHELHKEHLSRRDGRLGRLLVATALFNFDLSEEEPPANRVLRFRRNGFPEHWWEYRAGAAGTAVAEGDWCPREPLCRWEYLAADLAHALFRPRPAPRRLPRGPAGAEAGAWAAPGGEPGERLYCRLAPEEAPLQQLELFSAEPESLLPGVQAHLHRRYGAEGIRILAALLEQLDAAPPGLPVALDLVHAAERAFAPAAGARRRNSRLRKVAAVAERLARVECHRVSGEGPACTLRTSRLLTVLDRAGPWEPEARADDAPQREVRVLPDPVFHRPDGATLAAPYRDVPAPVWEADGRAHPYLLGLYLALRRAWARDWERHQGRLELTARRLFAEAGLWVKESSGYRAVERLKQELGHLREEGYLGRWQVLRSAPRDPLDDAFRLEAPRRPARPPVPPVAGSRAAGWLS